MISVCTTKQDGTDRVWLDQFGQVQNWRHTKTFPGGSSSAQFDYAAPATFNHRAIHAGRRLFAYSGSSLIFSGRLEQPDPGDTWSCTVTGLAALAKDYGAHNSGSNVSALDSTIDQAITDGLPWTRGASLTNVLGVIGQYAKDLDAVLGSLVTQGGYWRLTDAGVLTTPTGFPAWSMLLHELSVPSRTLTGYANIVTVNSTAVGGSAATDNFPGDATLLARYGPIGATVDVTEFGALSSANVAIIANRILTRLSTAGLPWQGTFAVHRGQLFTAGGVEHTDLATVSPYMTVRLVATNMIRGSVGAVDVPVGQVDYDDATQSLVVTPFLASQDSLQAALKGAHRGERFLR